MRNIFAFALIAFATVNAAPSDDNDKVKYIDNVRVDFSRLSSGIVDENAVHDAIARLKQTLVGGDTMQMSVQLSDKVESILDRHSRSIAEDDTEVVPDQKERVMKRVEAKIAELKAKGKLPESFHIPENFELPEGLKMPAKIREKLNL